MSMSKRSLVVKQLLCSLRVRQWLAAVFFVVATVVTTCDAQNFLPGLSSGNGNGSVDNPPPPDNDYSFSYPTTGGAVGQFFGPDFAGSSIVAQTTTTNAFCSCMADRDAAGGNTSHSYAESKQITTANYSGDYEIKFRVSFQASDFQDLMGSHFVASTSEVTDINTAENFESKLYDTYDGAEHIMRWDIYRNQTFLGSLPMGSGARGNNIFGNFTVPVTPDHDVDVGHLMVLESTMDLLVYAQPDYSGFRTETEIDRK